MSIASVRSIEKSVHKANTWIKSTQEKRGFTEENALLALRASLQMLRDRLTVDEATDLGAQLPTIVRGIYYDRWRPADVPVKMDKTQFMSRIHSYFNNDPEVDPEEVVKSVIEGMKENTGEGEIKDIAVNMPADIKPFFD